MKGCKIYRETGVCRCKLYPLTDISKKIIVGVEKKAGHCPCEISKTENNKCIGWEDTKKELENNAL